jgi:hypothetical protein
MAKWERSCNSKVVALDGREFARAAGTGTAPPILWFATTQCVEGKQDLADLTPKDRFISAETAHPRHVVRQAGRSRSGLDLRILLRDVIGRLAWLRTQTHLIGSALAKSARGFLQTSSNGV